MFQTPRKTPVKVRFDLTPKTKNTLCAICGKQYENCNDRRLLIKDGVKTKAGTLFCVILGIDNENICRKTNIICRYCQGRLDTLQTKTNSITEQYESTKKS